MNIYVGNLSFYAEEGDLLDLFEKYGEVDSAKIIMDRETGRSRGFGFVVMSTDDEANSAIEALHESEFLGRKLVVNQARERTQQRNDRRPRNDNYRRY